jgi:hypothetical protein
MPRERRGHFQWFSSADHAVRRVGPSLHPNTPTDSPSLITRCTRILKSGWFLNCAFQVSAHELDVPEVVAAGIDELVLRRHQVNDAV